MEGTMTVSWSGFIKRRRTTSGKPGRWALLWPPAVTPGLTASFTDRESVRNTRCFWKRWEIPRKCGRRCWKGRRRSGVVSISLAACRCFACRFCCGRFCFNLCGFVSIFCLLFRGKCDRLKLHFTFYHSICQQAFFAGISRLFIRVSEKNRNSPEILSGFYASGHI